MSSIAGCCSSKVCSLADHGTDGKSWQGLYSSLNGWKAPEFRLADKIKAKIAWTAPLCAFSPTALGWETRAEAHHDDIWLALAGDSTSIEVCKKTGMLSILCIPLHAARNAVL